MRAHAHPDTPWYTEEITERPRDPSGVAAFMSANSKTPYITPSMEFSSGKGVVRGRRVQQLEFTLVYSHAALVYPFTHSSINSRLRTSYGRLHPLKKKTRAQNPKTLHGRSLLVLLPVCWCYAWCRGLCSTGTGTSAVYAACFRKLPTSNKSCDNVLAS